MPPKSNKLSKKHEFHVLDTPCRLEPLQGPWYAEDMTPISTETLFSDGG